MDQVEDLRRTLDASGMPSEPHALKAAGDAEQRLEDASIGVATSGVYGFRVRHPFWYGLIAFVLGGGLAAICVMASYSNWAYEGVDLYRAIFQVIGGGILGGAVLAIAAFAYARSAKSVS